MPTQQHRGDGTKHNQCMRPSGQSGIPVRADLPGSPRARCRINRSRSGQGAQQALQSSPFGQLRACVESERCHLKVCFAHVTGMFS